MTSRLDRLFSLLETGSTSVTRKAAAGQLGELVRLHSPDLKPLLDRLHCYVISKSWDTRVAAGYAVQSISENIPQWKPAPVDIAYDSSDLNVKLESLTLRSFNIKNVLTNGSHLSGGNEEQFQVDKSVGSTEKMKEQRNLINKSLGLDIAEAIGVDTRGIFSNDDLVQCEVNTDNVKKETALNVVRNELDGADRSSSRCTVGKRVSSCMEVEQSMKRSKLCDEEDRLFIDETDCKSNNAFEVWPFSTFCDILVHDLFDSNWETRHGAAIALKEIVNVQGRVAGRKMGSTRLQMDRDNQLWLEDKAVRTLSVIAMDRFVDFLSDDAVAPIRESCSQLLGNLMKFMSSSSILQILNMVHDMLQWEDWGTRHGGMLALKYMIAVRSDLRSKIFKDSYIHIFHGLKDPVDDVVAEAVSCFMPLSDDISSLLGADELDVLLSTLWNSLLEFDGISGSSKSILDLLSNIFNNSPITDKITIGALSHIPSLWPFMYESSPKVRSAALKTILSLLKGNFVQSESSSSHMWLHNLIDPLMVHVFQSLIVESSYENMQLSIQIWWNILVYSQPSKVQEVAIKYYANWMSLAATNPKVALDPTAFQVPLFETNCKKMRDSGERVDIPCRKYMLGCGHTMVSCDKQQYKLALEGKIYAAKLLGRLAQYAVRGGVEEYPAGETPKECFHRMLLTYLSSQSAWARHLVALILREWAFYHSVQCPTLKEDLCKAITELVYFDEIAWSCAKLQRQTKDFINLLNMYDLNVGEPYQELTIFSIDQINKLTSEIAKNLIESSKIKKKFQEMLEKRREELVLFCTDVTKHHTSYTLLVQSSLACAMVAMNMLPDKLTPLVKPLMDSIRKLDIESLQDMSAFYLPQLMQKCSKRDACPNMKIYKNLCTFMCVDETVTPIVLDNVVPETNGIYYLNKQEENANRNLARCSSITGRPVGRPRTTVSDTSDVDVSVSNDEQYYKFIQRRGCSKALINIVKHFGVRLKSDLQFFYDSLIKPLQGDPTMKIETVAEVQATVQWFQLLEIIIPHLSSQILDELVNYIHSFCIFLFHQFSVIRHMASRVFAVLTCERMNPCLIRLVDNIIPNLELPPTETCLKMKEGILEYIYFTIDKLELKILPFIVLLIVPLLARMNDSRKSIRDMATQCFAILIRLYPLESSVNRCNFLPSRLLRKISEQRKFLEQLSDPSKLETFVIPVEIKAKLRSYQQRGVNWLSFLNRYNVHGILCDDMGLGKTLQSICILAADHHAKNNALKSDSLTQQRVKSLIICPSTLTSHWYYEFEKFVSPTVISPLDYSGFPHERKRLREQVHYHDVVIASYKIVRNELDEFFSKFKWNYIILDEGHIIKNGRTKASMAIKTLEGDHRLILSGTPIQNNVLELWSLFDFLMPGYLGSEKQFNLNYAKPILQSRDGKASPRDQEAGVLAMEKLHRQTLPFLLRRIKEDVLKDLPPKITQDYYCELTPLQKELYEDFSKIQQSGDILTKESSSSQSYIFHALQYLKRVCNHPKLAITPSHPKYAAISEDLRKKKSSLSDIEYSTKMLALKQLLIDCGIGNSDEGSSSFSVMDSIVAPHRALVFCQMKTMIDIIENDLLKKHLPSVTYLRLDGSVPANMRYNLVQRFNSDPSIDLLLLTTHVGGLGLNLTGADTVIFVEHDWNPMKDLQAMDRAHRIGQKRTVNVYRLITKRTIEEKIMNLQKFKLVTARTVITDDNASLASMGTDQLLDLFTMNHEPKVVSRDDPSDNRKCNSIKDVISKLPELWDDSQYSQEYDFEAFLKKLGTNASSSL